ncbi:MAG TPA: pyruvate kinase, partial [Gemmataceae bacterium]|nr:pyruvate kinase [Gemmataceae bacterium]
MQRRTRIVATLGPSTDPPGILEGLLAAGLDVARINFSHGTAEEAARRVAHLREAARSVNRFVAVLADLPGPKLRARLEAPRMLSAGEEVSFAATPDAQADIAVTEPEAVREVRPGHRILLDDGRLQLRAVRADAERVLARVEVGGTLQPNKGVNLPDTRLSIPALTPRDLEALVTAAAVGADWLALSFVREPSAAQELRQAARQLGLDVPVMAKIERPEAVERADAIIDAFDGIMVARGDLGVEVPLEQVPHVQKRLINQARAAGKPVITATEMLDSMRTNPRPTRAEASDVANAIYDGSDAVMLSGETAVGQYPVEAVAFMDRIAREAEAHPAADPLREVFVPRAQIEDHMSHATCALAREVGADAIVAPTYSGRTPRLVARHRPRAAIIAPAPTEVVLRRLAVVWGLVPVPLAGELRPGEDRLEAAVRAAF